MDVGWLRGMLDSLREGIQILSPQWRYLYVNEAVARHGRKAVHELLGRTLLECYPGIEKTEVFEVLERCMRERCAENFENEFEYDNGQRAWFELRAQPCPDGLIVLSLDITERKRLEAALRQGEKLRALGQMAAGIAHDLKNVLNPIALELRLLRTVRDEDKPEVFERIEDAIRVGAETCESLHRFSRQDQEQTAALVDLNRLADAALEICRSRLHERARVDVRRERGVAPPVLVRAAELVTAVVGLVVNALENLPQVGTIIVRTGHDEGGSWLEVADDGPGIPPELQEHIFEPSFTTKTQGLGLAMVYAFVQRHGGRISVDTAAGRGTTIRMWFPAGTSSERGVARATVPAPALRVLLVEDDSSARQALQMLLEEEGFAIEATEMRSALERLRTFEPDALVVDLRRPGLDGVAVARAARERRVSLPVVIMSGMDASDRALTTVLRDPLTAHIGKPIDLDRLVGLLRRGDAVATEPERARPSVVRADEQL